MEEQSLLSRGSSQSQRGIFGRVVVASSVVLGFIVVVGLSSQEHAKATSVDDVVGHRTFLTALDGDEKKVHREDLKSDPSVWRDAEKLHDKSKDLTGKAEDLRKKAKSLETKAVDMFGGADQKREKADKDSADADKDRIDAKDLRRKIDELEEETKEKIEELKKQLIEQSKELGSKAKDLDSSAVDLDKDSEKQTKDAEKKETEANKLRSRERHTQTEMTKASKEASDAEEKSLEETKSQRMCVGLGGVKLAGDTLVTYDKVNGEQFQAEDDWQCTDWCQQHEDCGQSVFTWETKTCELFKGAKAVPLKFRETWPWFNSSFCGKLEDKQNLLDKLQRVYDQKPWVSPPHNCSWAGENCLHTGCCADVCKATWDFKSKECKWYSCFKRDENFASCELEKAPSDDWDGTKLGTHPNQEIAPAEEGKLVQGTRLYCFSVVMWDAPPVQGWQDSEGAIAGHWKDLGKNIVECDDHSFFDGIGGGSIHNIASFVSAWKAVNEEGKWKRNDWTIKVDPDAVFFPDHFRTKVMYNWRTPQGAAVYLRNTFYRFQLLGAIEALTFEATEIYFSRLWECESHLGQQGGEDYWLLQCLEGLGIDFQTDVALLHDKYAADENCKDPNSVAHHFFKKISDWDKCWEKANDAWNNAHADQ